MSKLTKCNICNIIFPNNRKLNIHNSKNHPDKLKQSKFKYITYTNGLNNVLDKVLEVSLNLQTEFQLLDEHLFIICVLKKILCKYSIFCNLIYGYIKQDNNDLNIPHIWLELQYDSNIKLI